MNTPRDRIRWNCPECGQMFKTLDNMAGQAFHCMTCQAPLIVPANNNVERSPTEASRLGDLGLPQPDPPVSGTPPVENLKLRIKWTCPHCDQAFKTPSSLAGEAIGCPTCGAELLVPGERAQNAPPVASARQPSATEASASQAIKSATTTRQRISWTCPHCEQMFKTKLAQAGTEIQCPACQAKIRVPAPTD